MLDTHITRIRNGPEHVKRHTALVIAGSITAMIIVIWAFTIGGRFGTGVNQSTGTDPFSIIKNTVGDIIHKAKPDTQEGLVNGAVNITPQN